MSMIGHSNSVIIHGGTFTQNVASSESLLQAAFEKLINAAAPGALHNSGERFDPPKCHPRTRLAVTERIMNWILGKESTNDLIMWLHGPAGAGKSAIAQRIAELCHEANRLLASFFFSKSDSRRNSAKYLFPTIAYQIARTFPGARALIEQEIAHDPLIFDQSLETQMVKLIVNPLQPLIDSDFFADTACSPRLIILDGLDEVVDRLEQTRILEAISNVLRCYHIPLIFLIASRPEQEISYTFNSRPLAELTARLVLDDTFHPDEDIRIFLGDSFLEIKGSHPRKHSIPASWPSPDSLKQLVYKSSGQFIYASTVVRFVKSIRHRPADRLDIILGLRPVHHDLPFAELDALYTHILSLTEYPDKTLQIIGAILVWEEMHYYKIAGYGNIICNLEQLLGLETGDFELYLADMTSLVSWGPEAFDPVRILHASFGDFLFDPSRSGAFTIDRKAMDTMMACHCLRHLIFASNCDLPEDYWRDHLPDYAIRNVAMHLSRSSPSPDLMDYLQKLSFEHLIESMRIHLSTLLQQWPMSESDFWKIRQFPQFAWENIFNFVTATQALGLNQSEYYNLRHRLFDQVLKSGLESHHSRNSSLPFLLCLRIRCDPGKLGDMTGDVYDRWNTAACQLTDRNIPVSLPQKMLFSDAILPWSRWYTNFPSHSESTVLREFLQDASRSGQYVADAEAYASASLSCLKYLSRFHLGAPINIHHTRRDLARRQNSPWHWRRNMKLISGQPISTDFWYNGFSKKRYYSLKYHAFDKDRENLWQKFRHLRERAERRQTYLNATHLALVFLRRALPRSAKSDELVAFLNADKSFSQRAMQFPAKLKKAKAAIATYLARVQQSSGEESSMVEA